MLSLLPGTLLTSSLAQPISRVECFLPRLSNPARVLVWVELCPPSPIHISKSPAPEPQDVTLLEDKFVAHTIS